MPDTELRFEKGRHSVTRDARWWQVFTGKGQIGYVQGDTYRHLGGHYLTSAELRQIADFIERGQE